MPKQIISDNGSEFQNEVVDGLLKTYNIKIHFTTPYHHESNSPIERLHSTLIEHIRILRESDPNADVTKLMAYAIIAFNNTIHSSTKFTPYELVLGHTDCRDPMDLIPSHVYTEYLNNDKNNTHALYNIITELSKEHKQKTIDKINKTKTSKEPIIGSQVYNK